MKILFSRIERAIYDVYATEITTHNLQQDNKKFLPQIEQFISFPSTESYSLRTSITPSSSKVRWCGVVVELHWLGNLAFFLLPPVSTASKTSLASTVVSGIFSHQKNQKKLLLERRNTAKHRRGGWDAAKIFFPAFPRGRKNTSYLHFDNNNRVDCRPVIGQQQNNERRLNGI